MTTFTLTADQEAVTKAFIGFMLSDEREFVLSGSAGVGKTTLLKYLVNTREYLGTADLLGMTKPLDDWYFTATTNKAAEVLYHALGGAHDVTTIHSLLGITVENDYQTGAQKLRRKGGGKVIERGLIVIDECSMIDRELLRLIDQCTFNCKFVFVGDHCQLAPVMEQDSPVFADTSRLHELRQVVRSQHTPSITQVCQQLRQIVETGQFTPIQGTPGSVEFLTPEQAEREIRMHFVDPVVPENARILCYTNKTVNELNRWIRTEKGMPNHFVKNELVVANNCVHSAANTILTRIEQELCVDEVSEEIVTTVGTTSGMYHGFSYREVTTACGSVLKVPDNPFEFQSIVKAVGKEKDWGTYFNLKERFADLRPSYASTVYKAQGSTYQTVFVHLSDIGSCTQSAQVARMLYVACSRPTHRICFIGQLPARFH